MRIGVVLTALCALWTAPSAAEEPQLCQSFVSPFQKPEGRDPRQLLRRVSGKFGDYRASYVRGHKHSGVDLDGRYREPVFAACPGRVIDIHLDFPHRTVVLEHLRPGGQRIMTTYKHITDIRVREGDAVTTQTQLGRLFDAEEHKASGFRTNHLHLEVRRSFDDGGSASWTTMTVEELERIFVDPLVAFAK